MVITAPSAKTRIAEFVVVAVIGGSLLLALLSGCSSKEGSQTTSQNVAPAAPAATQVAPAAQPAPAPVAQAPKAPEKTAAPAKPPKSAPAPEAKPEPKPAEPVAAAPPPCGNCGVVKAVEKKTTKGEVSGGGALAGAAVGGLAGHQMGEGKGKDVATVLGVVGGALAGNAIEKNAKKKTEYVVTIAMDDGKTETITLKDAPALAAGDKVKIVDGKPVKE